MSTWFENVFPECFISVLHRLVTADVAFYTGNLQALKGLQTLDLNMAEIWEQKRWLTTCHFTVNDFFFAEDEFLQTEEETLLKCVRALAVAMIWGESISQEKQQQFFAVSSFYLEPASGFFGPNPK